MDYLLVDHDQAIFMPLFGPAIVTVRNGALRGTGPATRDNKPVCLDGDEKNLSVPGCSYLTLQYSIMGSGTLSIAALGPEQLTLKTRSGGKKILLKGASFVAKFTVTVPAQQPPPGPGAPIPDPTPEYSGQGQFLNSNFKFRGI